MALNREGKKFLNRERKRAKEGKTFKYKFDKLKTVNAEEADKRTIKILKNW